MKSGCLCYENYGNKGHYGGRLEWMSKRACLVGRFNVPSWATERALQGELTGLVNFQRAPKDFAAAAERNRSARRKNFQRPLKTKFYTIEPFAVKHPAYSYFHSEILK